MELNVLNLKVFNLMEEVRREMSEKTNKYFCYLFREGVDPYNKEKTIEKGYLFPGKTPIIYFSKSENKDKKYNNIYLTFTEDDGRLLLEKKEANVENVISSIETQILNRKESLDNYFNSTTFDDFCKTIKIIKEQYKLIKDDSNNPGYYIAEEQNESNQGDKGLSGTGYNKNEKLPMNLILYGPPGTGKTYHTVDKALDRLLSKNELDKLLEGKKTEGEKRKAKVDRFNELKSQGRIVFTTFHQSMSYEDFIEGIKPETDEDGNVTYEVKPGIFKQLCEKANPPQQDNFEEAWEDLVGILNNQTITIQNISKTGSFEIKLCPNGTSVRITTDSSLTFSHDQLYRVYKGMPGTPAGGYDNYRKAIINEMKSSCGLKDYKAFNEQSGENSTKKPYVLIIDEINRGNVANIFGELITLIEEDKRLTPGKTNIYTVELPYSNEEFGVPSNLYIIGTMNTADRSVEALDTALRRRFSFEEMMPKPELLENRIVNVDNHDYDLSKLLNIINKRLEVLKDREHQIGHSYFMKVVTEAQLTSVFFDKIIPLLQEYFYGDYEKIQLVLGDGFVKGEKTSVTFANNKSFEGLPEQVYSIIDYNSENSDGFDLSYALKKLMNIDEKKDETTTITTSENV